MAIDQNRLLLVAHAGRFFQNKIQNIHKEVQYVMQQPSATNVLEMANIIAGIIGEGDNIAYAVVIEKELAHFSPSRMKINNAAARRQRAMRSKQERSETAPPIVDKATNRFVGEIPPEIAGLPSGPAYLDKLGLKAVKIPRNIDPEIERLIRQGQEYKQPTADDGHDIPKNEDELFAEPEDKNNA